jgi:hypothetical protein
MALLSESPNTYAAGKTATERKNDPGGATPQNGNSPEIAGKEHLAKISPVWMKTLQRLTTRASSCTPLVKLKTLRTKAYVIVNCNFRCGH